MPTQRAKRQGQQVEKDTGHTRSPTTTAVEGAAPGECPRGHGKTHMHRVFHSGQWQRGGRPRTVPGPKSKGRALALNIKCPEENHTPCLL